MVNPSYSPNTAEVESSNLFPPTMITKGVDINCRPLLRSKVVQTETYNFMDVPKADSLLCFPKLENYVSSFFAGTQFSLILQAAEKLAVDSAFSGF